MRADEALRLAKEKLSAIGEANSALYLLCISENLQKTDIIAHPQIDINEQKYFEIIEKRLNFYPIEYITGAAYFYNEEFLVNENVLIPREETAILVEIALDIAKKIDAKNIADIGTGSGIIACMLKKHLDSANIIACDISRQALEVAKQNANRLSLQIDFRQGDLLEPIEDEDIDLIVSNPPYVANDYKLDSFVLKEPHGALFGGARGDEILIRILDLFANHNAKALCCEMGYDQKVYIQEHCKILGFTPIFYKDLAGFDRGFLIIK